MNKYILGFLSGLLAAVALAHLVAPDYGEMFLEVGHD